MIYNKVIERNIFDSLDINDCDPNPCQNGGECIDEVNDYTCECTSDWTGENCELSMTFT